MVNNEKVMRILNKLREKLLRNPITPSKHPDTTTEQFLAVDAAALECASDFFAMCQKTKTPKDLRDELRQGSAADVDIFKRGEEEASKVGFVFGGPGDLPLDGDFFIYL